MKRSLIFFMIYLFLSGCVSMHSKKNKNEYGTIIILNGPSVAGKSSIQKAFQKLAMPNLWVKVGIDNLFDQPMPDITPRNLDFWQKKNAIRWVSTNKDEQGNTIVTLHVGEQGERVAYGMNNAIAAYALAGCNVIVDYIAYKKEWFHDLKNKLSDLKTIYVAVDISLNELEKREAKRKTSPVGHARSHYSYVHWNIDYDLRVNSEDHSANEIAKQIYQFVHTKR